MARRSIASGSASTCPSCSKPSGHGTPPAQISSALGGSSIVEEVPIPIDCVDGFGEAFYARPEAFLDPGVRASQSAWGFIDEIAVERGIGRLREAIECGAWDERHGHLRSQPEFVGALRLIVTSIA